jgi:hypothetical protein
MNWPARHPALALALALLLAAGALASALRLRADTSLGRMFPANDRAAAALVDVLDQFPTAEEFLILVSTPGQSARPDELTDFATKLRSAIDADPAARALVSDYSFRADADMRDFFTKVLVPNGIYYLNDSEFAAARARLTRPRMIEQLRQDEAMLAAPGPEAQAMGRTLIQDPLRLRDFMADRLFAMRPVASYHGSDAFLSPDGRSLLIRIAGAKPPSDLAFCARMTDTLSALANRINGGRLKLEFSGAYAIAAQSQRSIRADSIRSVIGSIIGLALLFLIVFRRALPLFFVTFAPVALGTLYGIGTFALFNPHISPLSAVIGGMLAGIGIDYSVFYLVSFQQARAGGAAPVEAAGRTILSIGGAMVAAWATSIVGFIAVGFGSIPALRDFAILGSLGLTGALLGGMLILPAALVLLERISARPSAARVSAGPLMGWIDRHRRACGLTTGAAVLAAVAVLAVRGAALPMESDVTVLHPRPNPPLDAEARITKVMGVGGESLIVHLTADSPAHLVSLAHAVDARLLSAGGRKAGIQKTFGLATLLPDPARAAARQRAIGPAVADRVIADFNAALATSAFKPGAFAAYREFLRRLLTADRPPGVSDLLTCPRMAALILPRSALSGSPPTRALTLVTLRQSLDDRATRDQALASIHALLRDFPGATLTGMAVLSQDTQAVVRHDLPRMILAAVGLVVLYLLGFFRSFWLAALALLPTVVSLVCLLAFARAVDARLNLANIIAIPLLIGIDVDYGIFLVSVARRCATRAQFVAQAPASGLAVMVCAASTLLGFGSLAWTSVPAVRSLGWAVAIGVATCAASTLFLLYPILLWRLGKRDPAAVGATRTAS